MLILSFQPAALLEALSCDVLRILSACNFIENETSAQVLSACNVIKNPTPEQVFS